MRSVFAMVKGAVLALCMISLVIMPSMAGAANVKGLGSRVELLASFSNTSLATGAVTLATFNVPSWAHSVMCIGLARNIVGAGLANLTMYANGFDPNDDTAEWAGTYFATTGVSASPPANTSFVLHFGIATGLAATSPTTSTSSLSTLHGATVFCPRRVVIKRSIATAPATSWLFSGACYGIGG